MAHFDRSGKNGAPSNRRSKQDGITLTRKLGVDPGKKDAADPSANPALATQLINQSLQAKKKIGLHFPFLLPEAPCLSPKERTSRSLRDPECALDRKREEAAMRESRLVAWVRQYSWGIGEQVAA